MRKAKKGRQSPTCTHTASVMGYFHNAHASSRLCLVLVSFNWRAFPSLSLYLTWNSRTSRWSPEPSQDTRYSGWDAGHKQVKVEECENLLPFRWLCARNWVKPSWLKLIGRWTRFCRSNSALLFPCLIFDWYPSRKLLHQATVVESRPESNSALHATRQNEVHLSSWRQDKPAKSCVNEFFSPTLLTLDVLDVKESKLMS